MNKNKIEKGRKSSRPSSVIVLLVGILFFISLHWLLPAWTLHHFALHSGNTYQPALTNIGTTVSRISIWFSWLELGMSTLFAFILFLLERLAGRL